MIPRHTHAHAQARGRARARARARAGISDIGNIYWMSDIDIRRQIYILDVHRYRKYWCHFVLNDTSSYSWVMASYTTGKILQHYFEHALSKI